MEIENVKLDIVTKLQQTYTYITPLHKYKHTYKQTATRKVRYKASSPSNFVITGKLINTYYKAYHMINNTF